MESYQTNRVKTGWAEGGVGVGGCTLCVRAVHDGTNNDDQTSTWVLFSFPFKCTMHYYTTRVISRRQLDPRCIAPQYVPQYIRADSVSTGSYHQQKETFCALLSPLREIIRKGPSFSIVTPRVHIYNIANRLIQRPPARPDTRTHRMHASMAPELMGAAATLTTKGGEHSQKIATRGGEHHPDVGRFKRNSMDDVEDHVRPFQIGFVSTLFGEKVSLCSRLCVRIVVDLLAE